MKDLILLLGIAFLSGCAWPPLREYNYDAPLPPSVKADLPFARRFADKLCADAAQPMRRSELSDSKAHWGRSEVELSTERIPRVVVGIITYRRRNTLRVQIYGDIDSPLAKAIALKAQELFAQEFPGHKLTPFTRYETLVGP